MAECVEKLPHSCGSSDALQVFQDDHTGKFTAYCFACDTYEPSPYEEGEKPKKKVQKSAEKIRLELEEISEYRTVDLPTRKLTKKSLEYFGVKVGVSEQDGTTPVFHYYPYYQNGEVVGYKARLSPKTFWSVGSLKDAELFGWQQALQTGAKALYITEGELDAVALYQALKNKARGSKYEAYNPAVVSLISGGTSAKKDLAKFLPSLSSNFKEIVLVFDQDKAGAAAVKDAMQILPYAKTVTLPAKDANECIIKGFEMALCNAVLFKKERPKNTRLVWGWEVEEEARKETPMGLSWPWEGLTALTRGMRFGETIYLGSGVKMGKTTMVGVLAAHLVTKHDMKVMIVQPEEPVAKSYRLIAGQIAKRRFDDPNIPFDYAEFDKAKGILSPNLRLLDLYQSLDWNILRGDIQDAVLDGCQAVFIDPITNLTNGIDAASSNTILQEFAQELAFMAKDLNIMIFMFCHLKAPLTGASHERGGKVFSSQFAGSRAMMRSCHLMLGLEGDKDPDLDRNEQVMRRLTVLEDRAFGSSGYVSLFFDEKTGLYHEIKEA